VRLSDGEFEPNVNETIGGVDMIAWAAAQPWSGRGVSIGTARSSACTPAEALFVVLV